jgi:two-component system, LytTR family, sensor kinase
MEHPVINNWISRLVYWAITLIVGLSQALFNIHQGILPVFPALLDGLTFGLLLGLFGFAIWYVVKYNNLEENSLIQVLTSHLVAAIVFTSLWTLASGLLVKSLLQNPLYDLYFDSHISARIFQGFMFYTLLASIYYLYVYSENNKQKRSREAELLDQLKNAQLTALKSQINPHFLFNSLNSISSLTITNPAKAQKMIIALSDFMRYSLKKNMDEMVSLDTELQNINLYLQIEKIRFGDKLSYNFEVEEACKKHLIPNLILQPIFENAIKYGVYETSESVEIRLKAVSTSTGLILTVVNNFDPDAVSDRGNGVGLKNIRERLRIIYGSSQLLSAEKENNVFRISLEIPDKYLKT